MRPNEIWRLSFALAFLLTFSGNISAKDNCGCVKAQPDETTRQGANETITFVYRKPYQQIRGVVLDPVDAKRGDALVEVFTHPEHLLPDYPEKEKAKVKQRRLAACKTTANNNFCFPNLPAGKYELRISKDSEWKTIQIYLVVAPHNRKSSRLPIKVYLEVGQ
jgi:hypothetical protein